MILGGVMYALDSRFVLKWVTPSFQRLRSLMIVVAKAEHQFFNRHRCWSAEGSCLALSTTQLVFRFERP